MNENKIKDKTHRGQGALKTKGNVFISQLQSSQQEKRR